MQISNKGLDLIKKYENFVYTSYLDVGGKLTIGWGHKIDPYVERFEQPISLSQATDLLEKDIQNAIDGINKNVSVPLIQGQVDALISLVYNWGIGDFIRSIGFKFLNERKYSCARSEFFDPVRGVVRVNGIICPGLVNRRCAEAKLWDGL